MSKAACHAMPRAARVRFVSLVSLLSLALLAACALIWFAAPAAAQQTAGGLISQDAARRIGLTRAWQTQVDLDRSRNRVTHLKMHVRPSKTQVVYEVSGEGVLDYFSERELDPFGEPRGPEGAKRRSEERRAELLNNKVPGVNWRKLEVPEVTLYAVTSNGLVQAIDGETGRTHWSVTIGSSDHPTLEPGVGEAHVAVVNGSNLYLLDAETGKIIGNRRLGGAPGAGPAITSRKVCVPMVGGQMERYDLKDFKSPMQSSRTIGRALVQPTVSPNGVHWPTDRGFVNVADPVTDGMRYRIEANDTVVSPTSYRLPSTMFFGSVDGYAYAVHEISGTVLWRFSVGEPIEQTPAPVGDAVYVVSSRGGLFKVSLKDGRQVWWAPKVTQFLAADENRVYALDNMGRLLTLSAQHGNLLGEISAPGYNRSLTNWMTDRIYLATDTGNIQCLRSIDAAWPTIHVAAPPSAPAQPAGPAPTPTRQPPAGAPDPGDIDDPFGAGGDEPKPADPGDDVDPFGAGGGDDAGGGDNDNPFGAGGDDDPFG